MGLFNNKLYYYKGKSMTLKDFSDTYRIEYSLLKVRIDRGWSISQAIETPKQTVALYLFNGQTKSLQDWAKELNVSYFMLAHRINRYLWPVERALTEPVNTEYSKKKNAKPKL